MSVDPGLRSALKSIRILSPTSFVVKGEEPREIPAYTAGPAGSDPLVQALQGLFYARAYVREFGAPEQPPATRDSGFPARLARANRGRTFWDPGWEVYRTGPGGQVLVHKGDRHRSAAPGEYATATGAFPGVGTFIWLRALSDSFTTQPGFYYLFGETLPGAWDDAGLVRFYLHTTSAGICDLVEHLTGRLNHYLVPYRMKTLTDPAAYGRADGTVLYVAREAFQTVARLLLTLPEPVAGGLRPRVPLFTWRLRPGWAWPRSRTTARASACTAAASRRRGSSRPGSRGSRRWRRGCARCATVSTSTASASTSRTSTPDPATTSRR